MESIKLLKKHPYFKGIDFVKISDKSYNGVHDLVKAKVEAAIAKSTDLNFNYFHEFVPE